PPVPTSLDEITPEWMSDALGARVDGVDVEQIAVGEGFTSHIARVTLTAEDVPASVIVKIPSPDPGAQALGRMLQLFERAHRLDNMRFEGDDIVVFDWQVILATSGLYDVMYFVVTSLTTDQRRAWQDDLLARYLAGVKEKVDTDLTIDDVNDGFRMMTSFYCG